MEYEKLWNELKILLAEAKTNASNKEVQLSLALILVKIEMMELEAQLDDIKWGM